MSEKNNALELSKQLDGKVLGVIGARNLVGFEKAYMIATAANELKSLLTSEYMKPIMAIQGNKLGFKTDKDDKGGYPENIVKNCLIEAVLTGVQPCGNQFNIIAGNCYITKEGFGYLLANFKGLSHELIPALPRINADKSSAAIDVTIKWSLNGHSRDIILPIPVKMNAYMGTDAVIGKATRKARAWLYNTITGSEIADGDITDLGEAKVVSTKINKEDERVTLMIQDAKTLEDLEKLGKGVEFSSQQQELFDYKKDELKAKK